MGAEPSDQASVITVRARGRTGAENMELRINGTIAASWDNVSSKMSDYTHTVTTPTVVDTIRVHFTNDGGWPEADRNLIVDNITIDGQTYESEAPTTKSSGSWTSGTRCTDGYKTSEWLHCLDAWLEYQAAAGTELAGSQAQAVAETVVIYDTDMGVDIDDALGLAMLHGYEKAGDAKLAAVTISRNSDVGARYVDAVNGFYGRPDIPIGVYRGKTNLDRHDRFAQDVVDRGLYPHDVHLSAIPEAYRTMRQVLAEAEDDSVVIVQVGLSGNTARLLESGPDEISPLTGLQLVENKVRVLTVMGGDNSGGRAEFNIVQDLANARIVFSQWPEELLQNEARLGDSILYPGSSVFTDFEYVDHHPIKDAYLAEKLPWHEDAGATYNMRTWDLMSVLSAVEEPEAYFAVSGSGRTTIDQHGYTSFSESGGNHRTLGHASDLTATQRSAIVARLRELVTESP
ncbi:MAG: carbohydrate-binding domain-containing protein [Acidimicrobiales bacterium]